MARKNNKGGEVLKGMKRHKCDTYCLVGSDFELNLSFKTREDLISCLNTSEVSEEMLAKIFEGLIVELLQNLKDGFLRFISTQEFEKWTMAMGKGGKEEI